MSLATGAESAPERSPRRSTPPLSWRLPLAGAAVAGMYFLTGTFGLRFQSVHGSASPVWPPTGIALAALLLGGYALSPAVFAGAFFVNLFNEDTYGAVGVCLGIATGNTLEALAGTWLVERYAGGAGFYLRARDVTRFVLFAALATLLSSILGVLSLCIGGYADWTQAATIWFTWWLGDAVGALIMTPTIVLWGRHPRPYWAIRQRVEAILLLLALISVCVFVFFGVVAETQNLPLAFLVLPILVWTAMRFGPRETATSNVLLATFAIAGTTQGDGPFGHYPGPVALLMLQAFVAISGTTVLMLATVAAERRRGQRTLEQAHVALEHRMQERTAALTQAQDAFKWIMENVKDYAIFVLDLEGHVVTWNAGAQRITGFSADEVVGRFFGLFYPKEEADRGKPREVLKTTVAEGRWEEEGWRMRKDGSRYWASVVLTPLWDNTGCLRGFVKVTRDITERKRSQDRFRGLLESAPDAMVIVDADGEIVLANAQMESVFGYSRQELVGMGVETLIPERYRTQHEHHRHGFFHTPTARPMGIGKNLYGRRKDDHEFPVEISLSPLETDEGILVAAAIRDITARKQIEEKLRNAERLAAIGEMIAGLAHESRNALQRTHACLELLQLKAEDRPDLLDLTADIEKAQDHLRYLFDEVRGYAAPIRLKLEPVDLGKRLRETWQHLDQARKGRDARLVEALVPFSLVCRADPVALGQVFRNILENSLSMCADPVIIQVQWTEVMYKSGRALQIKLRDNGPGFTPEARQRIFEPFFTTKIQGTGLGMAIAKRIIEAHGGEIAIGNSELPGAEIQVTVSRDAS